MNRVLFCVLALLTLTACVNAGAADHSAQSVTRAVFEPGERLSGYQVLDSGGNRLELSEAANGRLVFYLSATCGDCIKEYAGYALLSELYPPPSGRLAFLWQSEYPEAPDGDGLTGGNAYLVPDNLRLGDWVPTYFRVDGSGQIRHKSIELAEAFAAFAASEGPDQNAATLAAYLAQKKAPLLLADSPEQLDEVAALLETEVGCRIIASGPAGEGEVAEDVWFDERDSAGIFSALSGATDLPALLSVSGGKLVVTAA